MLIKCDRCGKLFHRKTSKIKSRNYCSRKCFSTQKNRPCEGCGKLVTRCASQMREHVFCGLKCSRKWNSQRFTEENPTWNKEKMTTEVRFQLREQHLNTGEGKTYTKFFGVHEHRMVAAQKMGRKLKPGEVVHHIDGNKRNNSPSNLMVFNSQAEHARWHKLNDK